MDPENLLCDLELLKLEQSSNMKNRFLGCWVKFIVHKKFKHNIIYNNGTIMDFSLVISLSTL